MKSVPQHSDTTAVTGLLELTKQLTQWAMVRPTIERDPIAQRIVAGGIGRSIATGNMFPIHNPPPDHEPDRDADPDSLEARTEFEQLHAAPFSSVGP